MAGVVRVDAIGEQRLRGGRLEAVERDALLGFAHVVHRRAVVARPQAGGSATDDVKGKGQLSVNARGAVLADLWTAVASGAPLRLELHDGAGQCVAYEESAQ